MYHNIAVPVAMDEERDISNSVEVAKRLAAEGARITFIHVLESIPVYVMDVIPPDTLTDRRKHAEDRLARVSEGVENAHTVVLDGSTGRSICNWARDNKADLIVIASHSPVVSDIFLGSTALWVVRHASCAIHVLR